MLLELKYYLVMTRKGLKKSDNGKNKKVKAIEKVAYFEF